MIRRLLILAAVGAICWNPTTSYGNPPTCPAGDPGAPALIADFPLFPPEAVELGTFLALPTPATQQVTALGLSAVQPLIASSQSEDRITAMYSVFSLGEIILASEQGDPETTRACKLLVVPELQDLSAVYEAIPFKDQLDFSVLGTLNATLENLGHAPVVDLPPQEENCCVTDVELVGAGAFKGGKALKDYYPDLADAVGNSTYWDNGATAGPFDTGTRVGAAVQFVGTCTGDRSKCKFTQHVTKPVNNYPGEGVKPRVDDIGKSGRNYGTPPERQDIGANQTSFADPTSRGYNATNLSDYELRHVFETCKESSDNKCNWDKCCVQWTWRAKVVAGAVTVNTVTVDRKWCEKSF